MGSAGIEVLEIHSRKSQAQRTKTSDQFRAAKNAILFSSVRFACAFFVRLCAFFTVLACLCIYVYRW
jgi:hypothetical protein